MVIKPDVTKNCNPFGPRLDGFRLAIVCGLARDKQNSVKKTDK
jgi:hypothetical protein